MRPKYQRPLRTTVWCDSVKAHVEVEFIYHPGRPERWYLNNGDPGYPADPPEVEILSAHLSPVDVYDEVEKELLDSDNFLELAGQVYEESVTTQEP